MNAIAEHEPRDWFARGTYPSCSCGFAPRDNGQLIAHWRAHGIRWIDRGGRLVCEQVAPAGVAAGDRAEVIAAPGYPTEYVVEVTEVAGRTLTAKSVHYPDNSVETFTLRRNGKWAQKGRGQWQMYLRFKQAQR